MPFSNCLSLGNVVLPGTHKDLSEFIDISLPHPEGLIGLYWITGNGSRSVRNYADAAKPLAVIGTPTFDAVGARVDKANYFDTGLVNGLDRTWVVIAKPHAIATSNDRACLVTNRAFASSNFRGDSFSFEETNLVLNRFDKTAPVSGQAPSLSIATADGTKWNGLCAITQADGVARTGWRKDGTTTWTADSAATTRTVYPDRTLRIGGDLTSNADTVGYADIAFVALHNVILTKPQVEENMAYISQLLQQSSGVPAF
jgi:hypothetical protein